MKKLFILSLCFMFFVQNVEAGIFCDWWHHRLNECRAEKSSVEKKYKNETEQYSNCQNQHNNCQEQYSNCQNQHNNCQAERDSYKTWRGFLGVLAVAAVVVVILQCLQINKLKGKIERLHGHPDPYRTVHG